MKSSLISKFSSNQMSSNEMKNIIGGKSNLDTCFDNAHNASFNVDNGLTSQADKQELFQNLTFACLDTFGPQS